MLILGLREYGDKSVTIYYLRIIVTNISRWRWYWLNVRIFAVGYIVNDFCRVSNSRWVGDFRKLKNFIYWPLCEAWEFKSFSPILWVEVYYIRNKTFPVHQDPLSVFEKCQYNSIYFLTCYIFHLTIILRSSHLNFFFKTV